MKTDVDEAALFRAECLYWQKEFGLTDWTLQIVVQPAGECLDEAETDYDCDTRHAKIVYKMGVQDALHPADVACHEILHLLMADMLLAAVEAKHEEDNILGREEHKVIERLLKVLPKHRRK